ncbi:MAG: Rnf-Nqr domain containing protein, partial [Oscillospiraceae bacterium]
MEIIKSIIVTLFVMIFTENIVFSRSLGTDTIVAISKNRKSIFGFSAAVTYLCTAANILVWLVERNFRNAADYRTYQPIFYVCILCMLYFVSIMLVWKFMGDKIDSIRKYIHFAVFNSAVLGTMLLSSVDCRSLYEYIIYGLGSGLGYSLALYLTASVYDRLNSEKVPAAFRGYPLIMIYLGILSMAFFGFSGMPLGTF